MSSDFSPPSRLYGGRHGTSSCEQNHEKRNEVSDHHKEGNGRSGKSLSKHSHLMQKRIKFLFVATTRRNHRSKLPFHLSRHFFSDGPCSSKFLGIASISMDRPQGRYVRKNILRVQSPAFIRPTFDHRRSYSAVSCVR